MLVLSRKLGESLLIGDNIYIKIVAIDGKRIQIGIDADRSVPIVRSELLENTSFGESSHHRLAEPQPV